MAKEVPHEGLHFGPWERGQVITGCGGWQRREWPEHQCTVVVGGVVVGRRHLVVGGFVASISVGVEKLVSFLSWSNKGMSTQWNGVCVCVCDTRSTVSMLICQYVSDKVVTTSLNVVIYCIAKILFRPFPKWKDATWWHSRCVKQTF